MVLSNSDVPVVKRRQQGGDRVRIWTEMINETITGPFKTDEGV